MIALDTNVVVRLLVDDDPQQSHRAAALLDDNAVFVPLTVLLETEWVLRSVYALERGAVQRGLRNFLGLPNVTAEATGRVARALSWYEQGLDFADALHLASAVEAGVETFTTFDIALRGQATERAVAVVEP